VIFFFFLFVICYFTEDDIFGVCIKLMAGTIAGTVAGTIAGNESNLYLIRAVAF